MLSLLLSVFIHILSTNRCLFFFVYFFFLIKNIKRDSCAVNGQRSDTKSVATSPQDPQLWCCLLFVKLSLYVEIFTC